jgi:hypothetical protein
MVVRILDVKEALKQTVTDVEWDVRQDLVRHAEETYTDASTGVEEVDTR